MDCPELEGIELVEIDLTELNEMRSRCDEEDHEQIDIREELEDQHRMKSRRSFRCCNRHLFVWP